MIPAKNWELETIAVKESRNNATVFAKHVINLITEKENRILFFRLCQCSYQVHEEWGSKFRKL